MLYLYRQTQNRLVKPPKSPLYYFLDISEN